MSRRSLVAVVLTAVAAALPTDALASPQWLAPFDLSAAGGAALEQKAVFDGQDEALAIWRRREGTTGDFIVQVAIRAPGGPVACRTFGQGRERVCARSCGQRQRGRGGGMGALRRRELPHRGRDSPRRGRFGSVQTLSAAGQNANDPKVAIDAQGEATAVWDRTNGAPQTGSTVQGAIRPPGGVFDFAKNLSVPANAIYADWADVGVNAHGDTVAVWERGGAYPAAKVIQASFRGPSEAFGPAQSVTDPALVSARNPQVAVEDSGAALLAWPQAPNGSNQDVLQVATRAPGGLFGAGKPVSRGTEDANGYDLAANRNGDAVVVWESIVGGIPRIEAAQRPAGGAFGPVQDVSTSDGAPQLPSVAIDDSGNTLAAWKRKVDAKQVIVGAMGDAGAPLGAELTLSHSDQDTNNPSVAASPRGDGLAVWESYAGSDDIVQGAGFDRTGPTLTGLSVPASATAGLAASFGITARDVWSPVSQLTWSFGDGSSAEGDAVQHTFAGPGSFAATVTANDAAGNGTTSVREPGRRGSSRG